MHGQGKLPIVVGGTAYYATSLVFGDMLPQLDKQLTTTRQAQLEQAERVTSSASAGADIDGRLAKSTAELYADLQVIDPVMATRWHPNDHRKIRRSLEIYYTSGKRQSEVYAEQRQQGRLGPAHVKYRTLFLWLHCDQAVLDARLDARVDEMIEAGLFEEIRAMHASHDAGAAIDFTRGIYQAIGYKEFQAYLASGTSADREAGTQAMKAATRRYARRQIKWIRNKLLLQCRAAGRDVEIVLLDATDLEHWRERVADRGITATRDFLSSSEPFVAARYCGTDVRKLALLEPKIEKEFSANPEAWERRTCDVCLGFSTNSRAGWAEHLRSAGHKGKLKRQQNRKQFDAWQEKQRQQQQQRNGADEVTTRTAAEKEAQGVAMEKQDSRQSSTTLSSSSSTLTS